MYKLWYKCRSIFLASLYRLRRRRNTRIRRIQRSFWGIRAFAVPFLLPKPQCLPLRRASVFLRTRALEWTATGFLMIKPSLINLRMFCLELAFAISLTSLGSSQTFRLPHFITEAESLFWRRRLLQHERRNYYNLRHGTTWDGKSKEKSSYLVWKLLKTRCRDIYQRLTSTSIKKRQQWFESLFDVQRPCVNSSINHIKLKKPANNKQRTFCTNTVIQHYAKDDYGI